METPDFMVALEWNITNNIAVVHYFIDFSKGHF